MTFIEEELEVLEQSPEYKRFLKVYIKYQIHTLVQKLSDVGEESFLVSASVTDGTFSHVGSSKGEVFLDKTNDLQWKFLSFCSSTDSTVEGDEAVSSIKPGVSSTVVRKPVFKEEQESDDLMVTNILDSGQQQTRTSRDITVMQQGDTGQISSYPNNRKRASKKRRILLDGSDAIDLADVTEIPEIRSPELPQYDSVQIKVEPETDYFGDSLPDDSGQKKSDCMENSLQLWQYKHAEKGGQRIVDNFDASGDSDAVTSMSCSAETPSAEPCMFISKTNNSSTSIEYRYTDSDRVSQKLSLSQELASRLPNLTGDHYNNLTDDNCNNQCLQCKKCFSKSSCLSRHMRTHTGYKPFACTMCSMTFTQKKVLVNHIRTHTGEKPFCCRVCCVSFSRKDYLRKHEKTCNRPVHVTSLYT